MLPDPLLAPSPERPSRTGALRLLAGEPSATALVTATGSLTYAQVGDRVAARRHELGGGRRLVMVGAANAVEPLVTYLAALSAGHPVLLVSGDGGASNHDRHRRNLIERYDPDVVFAADGHGWRLDERRHGTAHELHPELALLLSTSGSSGSPKLVRLSRENLHSNARSIADYLRLTPADRAATTLPMHYSYGLSVVNSHLLSGASLMLTERSVLEPELWEEFAATGATSFAGVPHTFELLDSTDFAERELPHLRYATLAGGRLGTDRVRHYARLGSRRGFDFVVMYGQTEATARMSYLPPKLAESRAGSIGIPIPGGRFRIDGADGDSAGELVYSGPNVMLGYAENTADLALGRTVTELRTGDLARRHGDGLYEIVGRSSRFVKIYGLRIDLDRVEQILADDGIAARAVNLEERLVVFVRDDWALGLAGAVAAEALGLPGHAVQVHFIEQFPVTASGKPDVPRLRERAGALEERAEPASAATAEHVRSLYATILNRPDAGAHDSFVALDGDSLDYVEVSVRLEQLLGTLPRDWPTRSPHDLAGHAAQPTTRRPRRWTALVETPLVLRALAIVLVTGTHANLLNVQGGAHLLLGVLGFNLARFQLADVPRQSRLRNLLRSAAQIFVPAALWIGAVAVIGGGYQPATVFLVNGVLGDGSHWSAQWQYWFLEAVVWTIVGLVALFAIPRLDRLERRSPFAFAGAFLLAAVALRLLVTGGVEADAPERYSLPVVLWLIALGWLIARAKGTGQRLLASAVILLTVPGFFGDPVREAIVAAGLLLLLWIATIPVPRLAVPPLRVVASASLFVYLVQWQVYPALEDEYPLLATLASFAVGILAWRVHRAVSGWCAPRLSTARARVRALTRGRRR